MEDGLSTLANSEKFTPEGQHAACFPDPMANPGSIQNASANRGIRIFHQKSNLIKGVVRKPSQETGPFLLMGCLFQVATESAYCSVASHAFSLQSCSVFVLPLAFE